MAISSASVFSFTIFASLFIFSYAQVPCSNYTFISNQHFNSCIDLPFLDAHIHWNYFPSINKVAIAYRAGQALSGWIAWAINPTQIGMVGSQALLAFRDSNGSIITYTTPISNYNPSMQPGDLSFQVSNMSAEYTNNEMIIFAVLGPFNNQTQFNHAWQAGGTVSNNIPQMHSTTGPNVQSFGEIDFLSG